MAMSSVEPVNPAPLRAALGAQLGGAVLRLLLLQALPHIDPWLLVGLQGLAAMLIAILLRLPNWWWLISLLFAPLAQGGVALNLPPWTWLLGFILLLLVFWRTDASRVPLYLSNTATAEALAQLLPSQPCRLIDLGCGDGRLLRQLARQRPDCQFEGWEHAPLTWAWAWIASRRLPNLHIRLGSFWGHSLADYDCVYAFLSPVPMRRLWDKARQEMAGGALLISNSFAVPDIAAQTVCQVEDGRQTQLHVYQPRPASAVPGPGQHA